MADKQGICWKGKLCHLSSLRGKKAKPEKLRSHVLVFPTHWQKFNINHFKINEFCKMLFSFLCSRFSEVKIQMTSRVLMPSSVERITISHFWLQLASLVFFPWNSLGKGIEGKRHDLLCNLLICQVPFDVKNYNTVLCFITGGCRWKQVLVSP